MSTTHDPIAHAARLLREAAQELKHAHTIGGIAEWDGTEPEVQAVYGEHMAAAEAIEEWESAVGAGGVGPLRKRDDSMVRKADVIARLEQGFGAGSAVVMTIKHFFSNELPRQELHQIAEPSRECLQQSASISYSPFPSDPEQLAALAQQLLSFYADCLESDGRPATAGEARLLGDAVLAALQAAPPAPAGMAVPESKETASVDMRRVFLVVQHHAMKGKPKPIYGHSLCAVLSAHVSFELAESARSAAEEAYHEEFPGYRRYGDQPMYLWAVQPMDVVGSSAPAQEHATQLAGQAHTPERQRMSAGRASFFMERFLKEEKLLGPNEQAALHFVIDMLAAPAAVAAQHSESKQ